MAYGLLKGKKGIIFGALNDKSIAWKVAEKAVFGRIYALNIGPAYLKAQPSTDYDGGIVPDFTTTVSYTVCMTNNLKSQRTS